MQVDGREIKEIIQSIIDDPTISLKEKLEIISRKENLRGKIERIIKEKDIETIKLLNEKIFRIFYRNPKLIQKTDLSNSDWVNKRIEESLAVEDGRIRVLIGRKQEVNEQLRELYRVSYGEDFNKEVSKSKNLVALLNRYQNFFVNTKKKTRVYQEILQICQLLTNENFINFKELKERVENL